MTAPTLTGFSPSITLGENTVNTTPQLLDLDVTFSDVDEDFDGGILTLSGLLAEDRVSVRNQGTGPGQIGLSGSDVTYEGVVIGYLSGGVGDTLTITFYSSATSAAIEALIENLTYANVSNTPTTSRTLTLNITDAAGEDIFGALDFAAPVDWLDPASPFYAIDPGSRAAPTFGDLDGDGDLDLVIGVFGNGDVHYFENTGTVSAPAFTQRTGAANPFNAIGGVGGGLNASSPTLVDLDGDGDLDLALGALDGLIRYYENTGTTSAPVFTQRTGGANPFNGLDVGYYSEVSFVDLDGDGDLDVMAGSSGGVVDEFTNTGTSSAPAFSGGGLRLYAADSRATSTFADFDGDGDLDAVVGSMNGQLQYFENSNVYGMAQFIERTGTDNPFNGFDVDYASNPVAVDLDNDGDLDLAVGNGNGAIFYVVNNSPPPPTITVTVSSENDAPTATGLPTDVTVTEDVASNLNLSAVTLADLDASGPITVTLTASAGTMTASSGGGVTVSNSGTGAITLTGTVSAIDTFLNTASAIQYTGAANANGDNAATVTVSANDGSGSVTLGTVNVDITAVNDAMSLTGFASSVTFGENTVNATPQLLDIDVSFSDPDSFDGGSLTLSGLLAEDRVSVRNQGTGAGEIGLSGADVTYGGVVIGTLAGGSGATLTITFNASATSAAIDALIQNLTYANVSNTPTAARTLNLNVTDAAGEDLALPGAADFTGNPAAGTRIGVLDTGTYSKPSFVDLDGDGDLDMVVGNNDGELRAFTNSAAAGQPADFSGNAATGTRIGVLDVFSAGAPGFIDLDGDGDLDMVSGNGDGELRAFINSAAAGQLADFTGNPADGNRIGSLDVGSFSAPSFIDLDGDGDLDMVVGNRSGELRAFTNSAAAGQPADFTGNPTAGTSIGSLDVGLSSTPSFIDLDGDGDLDMVSGSDNGELRAFTNSAAAGQLADFTGNPAEGTRIGVLDVSYYSAPSFVDLDGDGDLDMVVGNYFGELRAFTNNAAAGAGPSITVTVTAENDAPAAVGLPTDVTVVEDTASNLDLSAVTLSDVDSGGSITVTLTASAGTMTATTGGGVTVTNSGTGAITLTGTVSAIDTFLNTASAIQYTGAANANGDNAATVTVSADDGSGSVTLGTVNVDITAVNDAMSLTGFGPSVTFNENTVNAAPQLLDIDVVFTDPDSFTGGALTITGVSADDRYSVRNEGTGTGQIGLSGANVSYGGVVIGTLAGGVGTSLTITFNAAATSEAIDALIQNLTYANLSDTPNGNTSFTLNVTDASGRGLTGDASFQEMPSFFNPLSTLDVGYRSHPTFADLDGDGDLDAVVGTRDGILRYFENTGNGVTAAFTERSGAANPFDGILLDYNSAPAFGDLDGDGDQDLMLGGNNGQISYFENTGTAAAAVFTHQGGAQHPLNGIDVGNDSTPAIGDVDGDGDLDVVVGRYGGGIRYFENTGSSGAATFVERTGGANPFDGVSTGLYSVPGLVDLDGDGDLDAVITSEDGGVARYFENEGGAFTERTGTDNPFNNVPVGFTPPAFFDRDGDGDLDLLLGDHGGTVRYLRNNTPIGQIFNIFITAQNDAPTAAGLPTDVTVTEDEASDLDLSATTIADGDSGNNPITVTLTAGAGTMTASSGGGVTVSGSGGGTLILTGTASNIDTFLNTASNIQYTGAANASGNNADTITVTANDGQGSGTVTLGTVNVDITNVADPMSLTGFDPSVTFDENTVNATPQLLDMDVTFSGIDSDFTGGTLTLSGLLAEDRVSVRNEGTAAGEIGLSGANVTYGGVIIGTLAGGVGGTLTITFNASATGAAVDALIQNLTYANVSHTPTASRDLVLNVTDAAGDDLSTGPSFTQRSGAANPLDDGETGSRNGPTLADLDGDGDMDLLVGSDGGTFRYFENTGTAAAASFTERTDTANPMNGFDIGAYSRPTFVDMDGDGDLDVFTGAYFGSIQYFENTGTAAAPVFTHQIFTGPLAGVNVGYQSSPTFADLDGDGDRDAVVGEADGTLNYFENTGTAAAAVFTQRTGAANPFDGLAANGGRSNPVLVDVDGDGDIDLVSGNVFGQLEYFENTGTTAAPVFIQRTGAANPFNGVDVGYVSAPAFADMDGDGDLDIVIGNDIGQLGYVENTTSGPGQTITVTVTAQNDAPTGSGLPGDVTVTEDTASDLDLSTVTVGDVDAAGAITVTLTASHGTLSAVSVGGGGATVFGAGTDTLILIGSVAAINAFLSTASSIQYTGASNANGENAATVTVQVDDGLAMLNLGTVNIDITAADDAMDLSGLSSSVTFDENTVNATPQLLDSDVTFTDVDSFDGGSLTVSGLLAEDRVAVRNEGTGAGQIGRSGADITYGGVVIGTFAGGSGGTLTITFNASATAAAIDALIQNLTYANVSDTPTASRDLLLDVTDADGGILSTGTAFITVNVTAQTDAVSGTAAGETLTASGPGDIANGLGGDDILIGGSGTQTLNGGDDNDTLRGRGGNDFLNGGAGSDTADYSTAAAAVSVRLASNVTLNDGDGGVDTLNSIENATGSAFNDTLFGNAGDNVLDGGLGGDILLGLGGNDTLIGGTGAPNTLQGGLGDDTYVVSGTDTITEFSDQGTDTVRTDRAVYTLGSHLENLTNTGTGTFTGNGNSLTNVMTGGSGRDTLNGLGGDDTLSGRGGQDTLVGGLGTDTVDYSTAAAGVSVRMAVNATLNDGDGSTDTLSGIENIIGSAFNDVIFGDANGNVLNGGLGADTLLGLDGNDTLIGGAGASNTLQGGLGDDTYVVSANDTITELSGQGTDTVQTDRAFFTLGSHLENLTYTGTGDFQGTGNSLANVITGGAGADTLTGGLGDDTLIGGGGIDYVVLSGVLADYVVTDLGGGNYRIVDSVGGRDGTDLTNGVERVRFASGPTVTLASLAVSGGVPVGTDGKSDARAEVLPVLSDDDFVMTKGGDMPEVLPGVDDPFRAPDGLGLDLQAASPWTMLTVDQDGLAGHTPDPFVGLWDDSGWNL